MHVRTDRFPFPPGCGLGSLSQPDIHRDPRPLVLPSPPHIHTRTDAGRPGSLIGSEPSEE